MRRVLLHGRTAPRRALIRLRRKLQIVIFTAAALSTCIAAAIIEFGYRSEGSRGRDLVIFNLRPGTVNPELQTLFLQLQVAASSLKPEPWAQEPSKACRA